MIDIQESATRAIESPIARPPEMARIKRLASRYRRRRVAIRTTIGTTLVAVAIVTAVALISPFGHPGFHVTAEAPTSTNYGPGAIGVAPDLSLDHFVTRLATAHHVVREGTVPGTPLAPSAHLLCVDGTPMRVYEYHDRAARAAVSATISPDGSHVGNYSVHWVGPPHFFADGLIIVLVLEDDAQLLDWLPGTLGPTLSPRVHAGASRDSCRRSS